MNKLLRKNILAENVVEYVFYAPEIVRRAKAGQFVILRVDEEGERVPFTVCDYDAENGELTLLVQTVGYTTKKLSMLNEGDFVNDIVGPLGNPTELDGAQSVLLVGGGIGTAVIYPQSKERKQAGLAVDALLGARDKSLLMYKEAFLRNCGSVYVMTDNGSEGGKGFVTDKLRELLESGVKYDVVLAVGPLPMMRAVCNLTKEFNQKTIISMNSVMVDGTGMCGCCRLTVNGETKYACVDGPEFDGHGVDFEEAVLRSRIYLAQEKEALCRIR